LVFQTFDSLLAKLIVTGQSYQDAISKLKHALLNTTITGVETNINFLIAILSDNAFIGDELRHVTIKALEERTESLLKITADIASERKNTSRTSSMAATAAPPAATAATALQFKPGDAFNVELSDSKTGDVQGIHSLQIDSISTNNFPEQFVANVQTSLLENPVSIAITRKSAFGTSNLRRKANPNTPSDVGSPVTGMVVEINVKEGEKVSPGQQLFVMSAMKMETVVQAPLAGRVQQLFASANDLIEGGDIVVQLSDMQESKL
jgi:acetyl/propionyl-CoA carboxylase alpha subunit